MKKSGLLTTVFLIVYILLTIIKPSITQASYSQAYSNYQSKYDIYRTSYQNYQVSKATYLTYKTLSTQNDALEKFRTVLLKRNEVVLSYLNTILEKMREIEGFDPQKTETFQKIAVSEENWITANQVKINAAGTIEDLNDISKDFSTRYRQIDMESKQAVAQILITKTSFSASKIADLFARVNLQLDRLNEAGEDTTNYRRGLNIAQSKVDLYQEKKEASLEVFFPKRQNYNDKIELASGQKLLLEGLQYLKESTAYLLEILNSITGN